MVHTTGGPPGNIEVDNRRDNRAQPQEARSCNTQCNVAPPLSVSYVAILNLKQSKMILFDFSSWRANMNMTHFRSKTNGVNVEYAS